MDSEQTPVESSNPGFAYSNEAVAARLEAIIGIQRERRKACKELRKVLDIVRGLPYNLYRTYTDADYSFSKLPSPGDNISRRLLPASTEGDLVHMAITDPDAVKTHSARISLESKSRRGSSSYTTGTHNPHFLEREGTPFGNGEA